MAGAWERCTNTQSKNPSRLSKPLRHPLRFMAATRPPSIARIVNPDRGAPQGRFNDLPLAVASRTPQAADMRSCARVGVGPGTIVSLRGLILKRNRSGNTMTMQSDTKTRLRIAALIYSMTNAVIFGAGIVTVLNVPGLRSNASIWIPVVVVASLVLAAPAAWLIAPRLRAHYGRRVTGRAPFSVN